MRHEPKRLLPRIKFGLLILASSFAAFAQAPVAQAPQEDKPFQIKLDVELVTLPVSVIDKNGLIIAGLKQENFRVLEDNVQQEIRLFKHEDTPLNVGIVIDNSASMRPKQERVHSAALSFVRESNPDDQTFVIAFEDMAYLQQDFTGSIGDLVDALDSLTPQLETAMYDAIFLGIEHVKKGQLEKKALLVISDGEDSASKLTYDRVLSHARESKDVAVYIIGLLDEDSRRRTQKRLTELAEVTGGQAFFPTTLDEVEEICRRVARDLRNQYTLGYSPKNTLKDGKWRTVRVELLNPPRNAGKVTLNFKKGYQAPEPE